jgi:hypothetical protein
MGTSATYGKDDLDGRAGLARHFASHSLAAGTPAQQPITGHRGTRRPPTIKPFTPRE